MRSTQTFCKIKELQLLERGKSLAAESFVDTAGNERYVELISVLHRPFMKLYTVLYSGKYVAAELAALLIPNFKSLDSFYFLRCKEFGKVKLNEARGLSFSGRTNSYSSIKVYQ